MTDPYDNYIDQEARQDRLERQREQYDRFVAKPISPAIIRVTLDRDETCAICPNPLMIGETAYLCETTHQVGCSLKHCQEAAEVKLLIMEAH